MVGAFSASNIPCCLLQLLPYPALGPPPHTLRASDAGSIVNWLKRELCPGASYDQLNQEAAVIPPGCDGLLALDHFQVGK